MRQDELDDDTVLIPSRPHTHDARVCEFEVDGAVDEDTILAPPPKLVEPSLQSSNCLTVGQGNDLDRARPAEAAARSPLQVKGAIASMAQFFRFRIGSHEPIALDQPVYIGRQPSTPRITNGTRSRLVRVSSPRHEVSRTHLEILQDGSSVVITDLKSTNGTVVTMPAAAPLRLRQGESLVVGPGTLVDIGDDICIEILPTAKATS